MDISCKKCGIAKPELEFYKHRTHTRKHTCKECYITKRKYYSELYKDLHYEDWLKLEKNRHQYKKHKAVQQFAGICADCKKVYPDCVFDFHHTNPNDKKEQINFTKRWESIQEELNKCVMLCANCHRIRHHAGNEK